MESNSCKYDLKKSLRDNLAVMKRGDFYTIPKGGSNDTIKFTEHGYFDFPLDLNGKVRMQTMSLKSAVETIENTWYKEFIKLLHKSVIDSFVSES